MKPINLKIQKIRKTKINDYVVTRLEIDLKHINYGLDKNREYQKKKRSHFTSSRVAKFFESLDGLELDVESDDLYDYFVVDQNFFVDQKNYRIVFCIKRDEPGTSGVITLFQINKGE